jgi:hypothetical protein
VAKSRTEPVYLETLSDMHLTTTPEAISKALKSFNSETAPGISGWTVPLLRLAAKDPIVQQFLHKLTSMIVAGVAPGANLLCGSRLTALYKKEDQGLEGGLRPIAVGELVYRLSMKAICMRLVDRIMLKKSMLGVKSPGGVEPIVRLLERALDRDLPGEDYISVTSLDFSNAFNTMPRRLIADALKHHAKGLFRAARWAYQSPSRLLVSGSPDDAADLLSSHGVRQGDPIGPFLWSIAYRPIVERLENFLGPNFLIVSYLDDTYIFSRSNDPLPQVIEFFNQAGNELKLNASKCKTVPLEVIRKEGFEILGTIVGPKKARMAFLDKKVDAQIEKIERLQQLNSNHASLTIFRKCYQQDLRHLQRSLDTHDIQHVWTRLDAAYSKTIKNMRASKRSGKYDDELIHLPVKMGGMGVLSHREVSLHARAASIANSDKVIAGILDQESEEVADNRGQGVRCTEALEARRNRMIAGMDDLERKSMVENASSLGRSWLGASPLTPSTRLDNFQLSTALHYRLLVFPDSCNYCGRQGLLLGTGSLGHDELCRDPKRPRWTITRHNVIVNALADAIKSVKDTRVIVEPATTDHGSLRRNDLLVFGSAALGNATTEHDVKVYSILGDKVHKTTGKTQNRVTVGPSASGSFWAKTLVQLQRYLDSVVRETGKRAPGSVGKFSALVFSPGGLVEEGTLEILEGWKSKVDSAVWRRTWERMSFGLVRMRAATFVV